MMRGIKDKISFATRLLGARILGRSYPLSVTFISTYRCNFTCEYCDVWRLKEEEMSTIEVFSMIDEFCRMGTRRFSFNGGEPLLREDIGDLIRYCKSRGLLTTMFTNGSLVSERLDELKDLDILVVSFDGPPHVHNKQRMEGSYEKVIRGIEKARRAGMRVWTNTVITRDNVTNLEFLVDEAKRLGVYMIFQPVLHYSHSTSPPEIENLSAEMEDYQRFIVRLKELKKNGAPIMHSDEYLDYIKVPCWDVNRRRCWAGRLYCAVTPGGCVAPCYPIFNSRRWLNGREIGFERAFKDIGAFKCNGCYCALVESDFIYSLRIRTALNLLRVLEV